MSTISTPSAFLVKKLEAFNLHSDSKLGELGKKSVRLIGRTLTAIEAVIEFLVLGTLGGMSALILEGVKRVLSNPSSKETCEQYQTTIANTVLGSSLKSLLKAAGILELESNNHPTSSSQRSSTRLSFVRESERGLRLYEEDEGEDEVTLPVRSLRLTHLDSSS